jgi:hypothetical protein
MRNWASFVCRMCLLVLSFLLGGIARPTPATSPPQWFWGCWVVTKVLPTSGTSGISPEQEKAIIGTRVIFTPTCARSGRTVLKLPKYSVKVLSARDFFKLGYFPLAQIGVKKQYVTQIELVLPENLSDLDFPGNEVYLREKDIVINVENDSFLAEKAKQEDQGCVCQAEHEK